VLLNANCALEGESIMVESWLSVTQVTALYTSSMLSMRRLRSEMRNTIQGTAMLEELDSELRRNQNNWPYWLGKQEVEGSGHLSPRQDVHPHYLMTVIETYRMVVASFAERSSWHKSQCRQSYEELNKAYNLLANAEPYMQMKSTDVMGPEQIPFDNPRVV